MNHLDKYTWYKPHLAWLGLNIEPELTPARANLSEANLSEANLRGADLSEADLSGANLSGANLSGANLIEASGSFAIGYFGKHHAIAAGEFISIGCKRHSYQFWLDNYQAIGQKHGYTQRQIELYGNWIKSAVSYLTEPAQEPQP